MKDDIIRMAREAGFDDYAYEATNLFERFYNLAVQHEREECAKLCEQHDTYFASAIPDCINAIRARGEKQ